MAKKKLTITLEDRQIDDVRALVVAGKASSVSGFVQHAVNVALHDAAGWQQMLDEALKRSGGSLTRTERVWADSVLAGPRRKRPRRTAAA